MSNFWPPREKKRPAPAHGIKIKAAGTTWWGARWIEALERLGARYAGRLARGKTYARAGRTHDFEVKAGEVTARVTGSAAKPYVVRIALAKLDAAKWERAIAAMAAEARFAAELLAGEMPRAIDEAFRAADASLFPTGESDLETSCSCPDQANPCKHIAATHYVLGEALDRDPFLLFELRGRTREEVLGALRELRSAHAKRGRPKAARTTTLGRVKPEAYDAWRGAIPDLALSMTPPASRGALLRQLGKPPSWRAEGSPEDALAPEVEAASELARAIALGQVGTGET